MNGLIIREGRLIEVPIIPSEPAVTESKPVPPLPVVHHSFFHGMSPMQVYVLEFLSFLAVALTITGIVHRFLE